ncbi:MAG TPA: glutamate racemase [Candidatus Rubrimentiphilum sp.]|nr:glutamate racemase [Candidatus Rubrimentiphilum sp.]
MSLGLFDSGLGGLTVLRRLREKLPHQDVVFFADQAHVPYGDRSTPELAELLSENVAFLDARGVDAIVMACNTSCATASQRGWPQSRAPIVDLIESAAIAIERAGFKRVGVIATSATARSGAYTKAIHARVKGADVFEVAAPALVPLVEAGKLEGPEPRAAVAAVCAELPSDLDAVILACTHYPLLDSHFEAVLGERVTRVDPAIVQAERAAELATQRGYTAGSGATVCVTSGDLEHFRAAVAATLGRVPNLSFERREPSVLSS